MTTPEWPPSSKVIPAQLAFLAIYNPALGVTDDTFRDQLVFYHSRAAGEAAKKEKGKARDKGDGGEDALAGALREEENERLRQIGLAQGMVDFARSFSNGEPVDSIETEKSRIVVYEVEKGWWILASIALTQLPSLSLPSDASKSTTDKTDHPPPAIEYSSREVSPPALLIQQLIQAHRIFCLHHGPSLDELFVRLPREKFCSTLDRFWTRFSRGWDVLLHGNPAVDIFSGIKIAGGGELGYGVGEEEWGSGEREVLEDLIRRTEGLEDVLVSRFGEPAAEREEQVYGEEVLPWLGSGVHPGAADGVVFSGMGSLERHSIRDVSLWMRQIYTYGEYAYGVRDNPLRERRRRRRRMPLSQRVSSNGSAVVTKATLPDDDDGEEDGGTDQVEEGPADSSQSKDRQPERNSRGGSREQTSAAPTGSSKPTIPPPIVPTAERARESAPRKADEATASEDNDDDDDESSATTTTLGIPDHYMKYLTLGLSTLSNPKPALRPNTTSSNHRSTSASQPNKPPRLQPHNAKLAPREPALNLIDPIPEDDGATLRARIAAQRAQETRGYFLIGLAGDLDALPPDDEGEDGAIEPPDDGSSHPSNSRIVLRTLQIDTTQDETSTPMSERATNVPDAGTGISATTFYRRRRVVVYVARPFVYCFLFQPRAGRLGLGEFYRSLHAMLRPFGRGMVQVTGAGERGRGSVRMEVKDADVRPILDLVWDPRVWSVWSGIPNIPVPGTPAAEGIIAGGGGGANGMQAWTRLEALNVHWAVLNALQSVRGRRGEAERTCKTSRGWWVVWMRVPPSGTAADEVGGEADATGSSTPRAVEGEEKGEKEIDDDLHRIVFLVRRAAEGVAAAKTTAASVGSRAVSSLFGNMSLGLGASSRGGGEDPTGGASAGWGPAGLAGGIGVDARGYVEGLLEDGGRRRG